MNSTIRKFSTLEAALITCRQFPGATVMIGDDFYAVGRSVQHVKGLWWSTLRENGLMVFGDLQGVGK